MVASEGVSYKHKASNAASTMASSILRFNDITFVVGKGDNQKNILQDVSGKVRWGHVLAVMGPSGAGKTTLISALTLDAFYGKPYGSVTLNGVPLTDKIFKRHCYVVKQMDKHWPYLTARETLQYAAELYDVADRTVISEVVDEMISKMGLDSCASTRAARLSGGQKRRLSIAICLLKQPTLLFLDEPTSGLDAAAASNIMQEITRVAREERLIILCTIHQPSTKVYNGFDQVMIMSKGREAFGGNVDAAGPYFESIGHPIPPSTNPAEHFLDLINADFSSSEKVDSILDTWDERKPGMNESVHGAVRMIDSDVSEGIDDAAFRRSLLREIIIMFRRSIVLIIRDPILYLGRCLVFLVANLIFAFVYWNARTYTQDQAFNKVWISVWFVAVPSNMGVVAVYALNDEFKSILRETKNGMVSPISYILAKTILVLPIMFIFSLFALGIPGFLVQDFEASAFGRAIGLWACLIYVFECVSEFFAVLFDNPILGMMQFMNIWFGAFLFGGFLIPLRDMYWPFELFYYIFPYSYYMRSFIYIIFIDAEWVPCTVPTGTSVCVDSSDGEDVLRGLQNIFPLVQTENQIAKDVGIILAIALFWKLCSIICILLKTRKVADINSTSAPPIIKSKPEETLPAPAGIKANPTTTLAPTPYAEGETMEDSTAEEHKAEELA